MVDFPLHHDVATCLCAMYNRVMEATSISKGWHAYSLNHVPHNMIVVSAHIRRVLSSSTFFSAMIEKK